jgi:hypothetical protein
MRDCFCILQIQKANTRVRHFGANCFMTEIQAEAIASGLAHYARQDQSRGYEIQIPQFVAVPGIPKHTSAGTAFDIAALGVESECGGTPGDNAWNRQPRFK